MLPSNGIESILNDSSSLHSDSEEAGICLMRVVCMYMCVCVFIFDTANHHTTFVRAMAPELPGQRVCSTSTQGLLCTLDPVSGISPVIPSFFPLIPTGHLSYLSQVERYRKVTGSSFPVSPVLMNSMAFLLHHSLF